MHDELGGLQIKIGSHITCARQVPFKYIKIEKQTEQNVAFSDLGVVPEPFGPKMESMVNKSSSLISPIYRLGRSLQAKSMQMKTYNGEFVFSPI